jgi:ATP-binding cassette subfamily C protein
MILSLPKGYDTMIGVNGQGLSVGQAQRIALARAFYRQPALLILDEPNAHLDAEGEAALVAALNAARERGAAIVVAAHRAGFMSIADKLLVVRDGRQELFGPRDQITARLAAAQSRPTVVAANEPVSRT